MYKKLNQNFFVENVLDLRLFSNPKGTEISQIRNYKLVKF